MSAYIPINNINSIFHAGLTSQQHENVVSRLSKGLENAYERIRQLESEIQQYKHMAATQQLTSEAQDGLRLSLQHM